MVVVDLASRSGFRFLLLGCISVIWHSHIQVMEFALFFFSFFSFLISGFVFLDLSLCSLCSCLTHT